MRSYDGGVNFGSIGGPILHSVSFNGPTTGIAVLLRQGWIAGSRGDTVWVRTEGGPEGASCEDAVLITLPGDGRAPWWEAYVQHNASINLLVAYGKRSIRYFEVLSLSILYSRDGAQSPEEFESFPGKRTVGVCSDGCVGDVTENGLW